MNKLHLDFTSVGNLLNISFMCRAYRVDCVFIVSSLNLSKTESFKKPRAYFLQLFIHVKAASQSGIRDIVHYQKL
jgi:hypothetical protein